MKKICSLICLLLASAAVFGQQEKWIPLFDGKTTAGWHTYGKKGVGRSWAVDEQSFHLLPTGLDGYQTRDGGDLVTDEEFTNFELTLEWKISKGGNSGIIFYVHEAPQYKETWNTGIETQVLDIVSNEDSKSFKHDIADIYDLIPGTSHPGKPYGEWNKVRIKSDQGKLDIFLNDVLVIHTVLWDDHWRSLIAQSKFKDMPGFGTFKKGRIALQDHGAEVWYRHIMLRKL